MARRRSAEAAIEEVHGLPIKAARALVTGCTVFASSLHHLDNPAPIRYLPPPDRHPRRGPAPLGARPLPML